MNQQLPEFPSFCLTFKNQEDFKIAIQHKDCASLIDISWSERILNFEDQEARQSFLSLITSPSVGIKKTNLEIDDD